LKEEAVEIPKNPMESSPKFWYYAWKEVLPRKKGGQYFFSLEK